MRGLKEKLVVIVGPTAVGKTKLGVELAKALDGEVISGDSMQIYRGMDIGTAKVTEEEMDGVRHHMLDIKEPTDSFSVAEFQQLVQPLITDINERKKIPLLVGGTGLYVKAITHTYQFAEAIADEQYRKQLEHEVEVFGVECLHSKLAKIDPRRAEQIHPNNYRRVIRALEIHHVTGKLASDEQEKSDEESPYELVMIGLTMNRDELYRRINLRVDKMIADGLVEEAQRLYNQGVRDCQSVQAIGYKEIYEYIEGHLTLTEAIELLKRNSRRYAKRQLTWFRNKTDAQWFDISEATFSSTVHKIIEFVEGKLRQKSN